MTEILPIAQPNLQLRQRNFEDKKIFFELERLIEELESYFKIISSTFDIEDWHEVGSAGEPALENSWVNYGSGWDTCVFYKDPLGVVHVKGLVRNGTLNSTVFTLPVGYRPTKNQMFTGVEGSNNPVRFDIRADGTVLPVGTTTNTFQSLWCNFRVD